MASVSASASSFPSSSWFWARAVVVLLTSAAVLPVLTAGCGSSTACVPGQSVACVGGQSCGNAYQVCKADGSGYGECLCSMGDGGGLFTNVGPNSGLIGAACGSDVNCRRGLACVTSSSTIIKGEGPSGGLCLARCVFGHDFCNAVDARAKCVVLDDRGTPSPDDDVSYCMPGCAIGVSKDPDKCRSREDLVCTEGTLGSGVGYCRPACRNDTDCKPRYCDIATGLCGDTAPSGDPIGADCMPTNSTCAGGCFTNVGNYNECSGVCSYGEPGGCGQARTSPPYDFFCYVDGAIGAGAGDLGYCSRVCNCDGDCGRPDAVCEPTPDLTGKTGRSGVCGSKTFANGTPRKNIPCQ